MKSIIILTLLAVVVSMPATALIADDDKKVEKRRVVKVVSGDGVDIEEGGNFVFVGDDSEPVVVRSLFIHRGGYLGVQLVDLTPELREYFRVPGNAGVMISAVSDDGPAESAGVRVGDIITAIDHEPVAASGELARLVRGGKEGDSVDLEVWRDGKLMTLPATLAERERPQVDIGPFLWQAGDKDELESFEMHLENLPESIIRIDEDHIHKAMGALDEHLASPEWKDRMRSIFEDRQSMEERIRELEGRLRELEQRLSKLAN